MAETWKGKTRGGTLGYLFFIYLIKCVGITAAYTFLAAVVLYFIPFAPKATRNIWCYARRILKYGRIRSAGLLLRNYYRLGQILIDKVAIGCGKAGRYHFAFEQYPELLQLLDSRQGIIMVGAHVGNWEIGAPFFDKYGKHINIVMYDAEHRKIKEMLEKNAKDRNYKVIPVNEDNLTHVFRITEALRQHEYVCFQGDRYVNKEKLLTGTLLGKEAQFPAGPFLLATRMKVPVVFYFAMREPHRSYRFHFIPTQPVDRNKGRKAEQALLDQYTAALEQILKRYPEQWFNYYPFWQTAAPEDSKKQQDETKQL